MGIEWYSLTNVRYSFPFDPNTLFNGWHPVSILKKEQKLMKRENYDIDLNI
jgi:hypothetical protein